jgi:hypothetical protein
MARPSKLSREQWASIESRYLVGESASKMAREFGITESAIRGRVSANAKVIKNVANQIVSSKIALNSLGVSARVSAINLADQILATQGHLFSAASHSAATANRLAKMAHDVVQKIDDANPLGAIDTLEDVALLSKMANDASVIGMSLLKSSKDMLKSQQSQQPAVMPYVSKDVVRQIVNELEGEY